MKDITVKHLLQILPMDEDVRKEALANFDSLSKDQRFEITMLCWQMFYQLVDEKTKLDFYKAILAAKEGKGGLRKNLYQKLEEKAFEEMRQKLMKTAEKERMEEVKGKLKKVVVAKRAKKAGKVAS